MYASYLGDFYNIIAAFQSEVASLERQIELERRDPAQYLDHLGMSIDAVMLAARDLENHLAGAQDLLRDTQTTFRRLTSGFFCKSRILDRALYKPRGYAGDHAMLDMLYRGDRAPEGIERVLDDWVMELHAVRAVRDRKSFVVEWLAQRLAARPQARVVDLACGPCRVERELFDSGRGTEARFVALDNDPEALHYAERVLGPHIGRVEFVQDNVIRMVRSKERTPALAGAELVVSLGLFDYLPRNIAVNLLRIVRESTEPGGEILVGNFEEGNPSQAFMEWTVDWPLIHRSAHDFAQLFLEAGFDADDLRLEREVPEGRILMVTARVGGERAP